MIGGSQLTPGEWQHITVTLDGATQTAILYVDGTEVGPRDTA